MKYKFKEFRLRKLRKKYEENGPNMCTLVYNISSGKANTFTTFVHEGSVRKREKIE